MRRVLLGATLLLSMALAGCIGDAADETDTSALAPSDVAPPALDTPWAMTFHGCTEQLAIFPVPMDSFEVPDGFALAPFDPLGLFAAVGVLGFTCAHAYGETFALETTSEVHVAVFVVPPAELAAEDAAFHVIPLEVDVTANETFATYESWGVPVLAADVVVELFPETPLTRAGRVATSSDAGSAEMYTVVEGPVTTTAPGFVRVFPVPLAAGPAHIDHVIDFSWTEANIVADGQAISPAIGGIPPVYPGVALHWWGDDYAYTLARVLLEPVEMADHQHAGPVVSVSELAQWL